MYQLSEDAVRLLSFVFPETEYEEKVYFIGLAKEKALKQRISTEKHVIKKKRFPSFIRKKQLKEDCDYYVMSNPILKDARSHRYNSVFSLQNIVVDIDFHEGCPAENQECIRDCYSLLKKYFEEKELPVWNIVHYTGRGLQLWWSVAEASRKLEFIVKDITAALIKEISTLFEEYAWTVRDGEVDSSASSKISGLFRCFGTINTKTGKKTEAHLETKDRYDIKSLQNALHIHYASRSGRKNKKPAPSRPFSAEKRLHSIEEIIKTRRLPAGAERRNIHLHHYYNTAVLVYDRQTAREKTFQMNQYFSIPLPERELSGIFQSVDRAENRKGIHGTYLYTNSRIAEDLCLNKEEQEHFRLMPRKDNASHNKKRDQLRKEKKERRNKQIMSLFLDGIPFAEIARRVNCCAKTVRSVVNSVIHKDSGRPSLYRIIRALLKQADERHRILCMNGACRKNAEPAGNLLPETPDPVLTG